MFSTRKKIISLLVTITLIVSTGIVTLYARQNSVVLTGNFQITSNGTGSYDDNRFTQMDVAKKEESTVKLNELDKLVTQNPYYELYFNEEINIIKLKNIETEYIYSSAIDELEYEDGISSISNFLSSTVSIDFYSYDETTEFPGFIYGTTRQQTLTDVTRKRAEVDSEGNTITPSSVTINNNSDVDCVVTKLTNGLSFDITFDRTTSIKPLEPKGAYIKIKVNFILTDKGIEVEVPVEEIESEHRVLSAINIMPAFGYTRDDVQSGYMFIPDGSGALIRYSSANASSQLIKKFYSANDYGLAVPSVDTSLADEKELSAAVYGKINGINNNGFITTIDSGAAMASLVVSPYGAQNTFVNYMYSKFNFNNVFKIYNAFEETIDDVGETTIRQSFIPLSNDDANYIGMANAYREHLEDINVLNQQDSKVYKPRVEFVNSENVSGLINPKTTTVTTIDQADSILQRIGEENYTVVLNGWNSGGFSGNTPYDIDYNNKVGSTKEFKSFINSYEDVYMYNDYVKSYSAGTANSFTDNAKALTRLSMTMKDPYGELYPTYNILAPDASVSLANKNIKSYKKNGITGLALDSLGAELFSYTKSFETYDRNITAAKFDNLLTSFEDFNIALYTPSNYLWQHVDAYFDMSLYSNRYIAYTDTVPFIPYVLKDSMDIYSNYVNFFSNYDEQILRLVDFNIMPSFIFTHETTRALKYTDSKELFTTEFNHWEDSVIAINERVQPMFEATFNSNIVERNILKVGVIENVYSNGTKVIINYNNAESYQYGNTTVNPSDFVLVKGGN